MKLLFDSNSTSNILTKNEYYELYSKLNDLVRNSNLEIIGCCTFLYELSGLADNDEIYTDIINKYEELTNNRILIDSIHLMLKEIEIRESIHYDNSIFPDKDRVYILENMKDKNKASSLYQLVKQERNYYKVSMDDVTESILKYLIDSDRISKEIRIGYREWFKNYDVYKQDWFEHLFPDSSDIRVETLSRVSAFFGYVLTRAYEYISLGKKDRESDSYDRSFYIDSVVVDALVTNDKAFTKTIMRIPDREIDVMNIQELESLIERMYAA